MMNRFPPGHLRIMPRSIRRILLGGAGILACSSLGAKPLPWLHDLGQISSDYNTISHLQAEDIDGDDDLDILAIGGSTVWLIENRSTVQSLEFADPEPYFDIPSDIYIENVRLADFDADGDLDLISGSGTYAENKGGRLQPSFPETQEIDCQGSSIAIADLDGDEDLDLLIGNKDGSYQEQNVICENIGSITEPVFSKTAEPQAIGLGDMSYDSSFHFIDVDKDGDLDAYDSFHQMYWENTSGSNSPFFNRLDKVPEDLLFAACESPFPVDIDADDKVDALCGFGGYSGYQPWLGVDQIQLLRSAGSQTSGVSAFSARAFVDSGEATLIGGFAIDAEQGNDLLIRGFGPSMLGQLPFPLFYPQLRIPDDSILLPFAFSRAFTFPETEAEHALSILGLGLGDERVIEPALNLYYPPGTHSLFLEGDHGDSGTGRIAFNQLTQPLIKSFSARGFVGAGDERMIGGFELTGDQSLTVALRALGPYMAAHGVNEILQDPELTLFDSQGTVIAHNDNWRTDSNAETLAETRLAPSVETEAALLIQLPPGSYTFSIQGKNGGSGIGQIAIDTF